MNDPFVELFVPPLLHLGPFLLSMMLFSILRFLVELSVMDSTTDQLAHCQHRMNLLG